MKYGDFSCVFTRGIVHLPAISSILILPNPAFSLMFRKSLVIFLAFLLHSSAQGQDSLLLYGTLPYKIKVLGTPIKKTPNGARTESWNQEKLDQYGIATVADILERESGVFIKSYGNGSLATTSIRGGSAGHTAVLWNGIQIQSPMLGQVDFSLLPTNFVDEMSVEYGGNSSLFGSGVIGGLVRLSNLPPKENGISLSLHSEIGSFGLWNEQAQFQFKVNKFSGTTRFFHKQVENNFKYQLRADLPIKEQQHAAIKANGLLQDLYWNPSSKHQLALHTWVQHTNREIPPTTTQNFSEASQEDAFVRLNLHYKYLADKWTLNLRTAYFNELLNYRDDRILLVSESRYSVVTTEGEAEFLPKVGRLLFGLDNTYVQAHSDGYNSPEGEEIPSQFRTGLFAAYKLETDKKWRIELSLRETIAAGKFIPPVANFSLEKEVGEWLTIKSKITRNYRLPTFNDLYWKPGGDPDLKPEIGWSEEATLLFSKKKIPIKYSLTAFNRNVNDWVMWAVAPGDNFYSANNITKVWSRGIEQRLNYDYPIKKATIKLSVGYDIIRSTNQVAIEYPKMEEGQQLIYTPIHQAFGSLGFTWKDLSGTYSHRFTSSVETLSLNTLERYHLGDLKLQYKLTYKQFNGHLFVDFNNIWNTSYRIIERRPMPGRSFKVGLRIGFTKIE